MDQIHSGYCRFSDTFYLTLQGDYLFCTDSQLSEEKYCQKFLVHPKISPDVSYIRNIQPTHPSRHREFWF